jgi:hypothetical protein
MSQFGGIDWVGDGMDQLHNHDWDFGSQEDSLSRRLQDASFLSKIRGILAELSYLFREECSIYCGSILLYEC